MRRYILIDGESVGPLADAQIRNLWDSGKITSETLTWEEGMEGWQAMGVLPPALPAAMPTLAVQMVPRALPCEKCGCVDEPVIRRDVSAGGVLVAILLFLFLCWPLCWLPLVMMREETRCCRRCSAKI